MLRNLRVLNNLVDSGQERALFSPYSLFHFLSGYLVANKIKFSSWILLHTIFEVLENTKTGVRFAQRGDAVVQRILDRLNIDYQFPIYQGDTVRNSFGDTISAALGYFVKRPKS